MPDLINYLLTGERITEFTVASTSLLMSLTGRKWNTGLMNRYGIDPSLFGEITLAGTSLPLCGAIGEELLARKMLVTTVAGHDTASAVIPIPARGHENYAFVSSGTWSVIGAPTPSPVIDMRFAGSISNEGCFDGSNRLVKNIFGMKLLNQLKYSWEMEGKAVSFAQMDACAVESEPFACFIDPENLSFFAGENMPGLIQDYCRRTYQRVPGTVGEFVRAVDESLAFCYKKTLLELEAVSGRKFATLFIVGGGTQNKILSQMAASACGIPVVAAAKESAALGNALMQLMACGELKTAGDLAACVQQSVSSTIYEPTEAARWQEKYADYLDAVRHQI
jgi:sugar (pentulose or hexulose) kinase